MRVSVCPSNPKKITMPTFIRQPVRLPSEVTNGQKSVDGSSNGSTQAPTLRRSTVDHAAISTAPSTSFSQMKNIGDPHSNAPIRFDKQSRPLPQDSQPHTSSTTSPSISSIMSSFQTFTNLLPSWSNSQQSFAAPTASSSLCHSTSSSVSEATVVPDAVLPKKRSYVSRKKQLQLLKAQMEIQGVGTMRTPVQCKKCDRDLVFI
jgi:hypothetical protein